MTDVSGNHLDNDLLDQMLADREAPLHPDLVPWVEQGTWGPMLRHPLVYAVPLFSNGLANHAYEQKREALRQAIEEEDWRSVIWIHERAHRLNALIEYVTGRNDEGLIFPLIYSPEHMDLAADVWVDSENIQQNIEEWRALIDPDNSPDLWLGTDSERAEFDALPDPIVAYRGGSVGDWSWTTSKTTAEFFSRRSGLVIRRDRIPKADCFGYLTRRNEYELLVRLTPERYPLVYPEGEPT